MARTVSLLRMAIVCISAAGDETEKRHLISSFICEGKLVVNVVILNLEKKRKTRL